MIRKRIEYWENSLLDLGKRNKLINFKESKRSTLEILSPGFEKLFQKIVVREKELTFSQLKYESRVVDDETIIETIEIPGDIETNRDVEDQLKTLKAIRNRTRTIFQEQGVNVLYLCFGFLNWNDKKEKTEWNKSPLLLVPINLVQRSIIDPFQVYLAEDEIVLNPTLCQKLQSECNVELPLYDNDENSIVEYLQTIHDKIKEYSWKIEYKTSIGIFLFHKINMFKDLQSKEDRIVHHPVLKGLCGQKTEIPRFSKSLENYDHDKQIKPEDVFQVLQADSSQQDAVLYAKKGYSFVLQGPPGTGKSQTITNIISECLADGKKVLFVSDKMAALEVVYKRLEETGLADYCLTLHNPRIKKTEFLSNIKSVLDKKKIKTNGNITRELHKLESLKTKLTNYCDSLHETIQPLNKTLFEACCEYLSLYETMDIEFRLTGSQKVSEEEYINRMAALEDFASCLSNLSVSINENPWYGFKQHDTTHEEREDCKAKCKKLFACNTRLIEAVRELNDILKVNYNPTLPLVKDIVGMLSTLLKVPSLFPEHYLTIGNLSKVNKTIQTASELTTSVKQLRSTLDNTFYPSVYNLDADKLDALLNENITYLTETLSSQTYPSKNSIMDQLECLQSRVEEVSVFSDKLASIIDILNNKYDLFIDSNNPDIASVRNKLQAILRLPKVCKFWFNSEKQSYIKGILKDCTQNSSRLNSCINKIGTTFDDDIYRENIDFLVKKFRSDYSTNLRIIKPQYYKDKKTIQQYVKSHVGTLKHKDVCWYLELLKETKEDKYWFQQNDSLLDEMFDEYYQGEETDWESVNNKYVQVSKVIDLREPVTKYKMLLLLKKRDEQKEIEEIENFLEKYERFEIATKLRELLSSKCLQKGYKQMVEEQVLHKMATALTGILRLQILLETKEETLRTFDFYESNINLLQHYQNNLTTFSSIVPSLQETFGFLFHDLKTDWAGIYEVFQWIKEWKTIPLHTTISFEYLEQITTNSKLKDSVEAILQKLRSSLFEIQPYIKWLDDTFYQFAFSEKDNLNDMNQKIQNCLDRFYLLLELLDYSTHKQKCIDNGLSSYIRFVEKESIPVNQIVPAYKKRFFNVWIDTALDQYPYLLGFQKAGFQNVVQSFKENDINHLGYTPYRIIERLQKNLPDNYDITSPDSEIGILKRELLKKRRIMPLRILFSKIPNLLKAYKPCFMMSPLSVSLFLESDAFEFDVVIFDEASQVKTEDAVGAIVRGKQIIVCGDQHQLPPTTFFSTTMQDNEYDDDDMLEEFETDDSGNYESVLEECQKILPEITLRWHYRSRDEKLIAFSNRKIYDNRLITFPSNVQKMNDFGVELVYCNNGLYDKGKTRTNKVEAQKVAELVFNHFKRYPSRSIGVVTFSNAQQNAVDSAITRLRYQHQEFEEFFDETANEPFFIKNLETVQGDERDVIILCVGYGKYDMKKPISMNFGPLNKIGGERRLNVAITRAKCNIKMVTSITSFDLDLSRTQSKGVKLLKEYLAFAENNNSLEEPSKEENSLEEYYGMEDFICEYLDENNIEYHKHVGFSDYKIDIAIPYTQNPNYYLLGIETDGEQYKSARTERERYITRHDVLQSMGWNIQHIWTPTILQNTNGELKQLVKKIKQIDSQYAPKEVSNMEDTVTSAYEPKEDETQPMCDYSNNKYSEIAETVDTPPFGLAYYEVAELPQYAVEMYECLRCVLKQETPIHIDLLCQRIAPNFQRKKVTRVFKEQVLEGFKLVDDAYEKKGNFVYKIGRAIEARVPKEGVSETFRTIDYLPEEEIMEAMKAIIKESFSISEEGLIDTTARVFGYNRTGEQIHKKLHTVLHKMLQKGVIQKQDDKITVVSEE